VILLCTGGRLWTDRDQLNRALDYLHGIYRFDRVAHGAAYGADAMINQWACAQQGVKEDRYPVLPIDGSWPAAGHQRNARMLRCCLEAAGSAPRSIIGVAFHAKPDPAKPRHGNGTRNMVEQMRAASVYVFEVFA
jgi:hypothetical protein